jgi:predicted phosphodiesterase
MRLAVLSDVHGNLQALEAVLEHAQKQKVDQIIVAGDLVVGLPDSRACWDLIQSLKMPMIRGNHERYLAHFGTEKLNWSGEQFKPISWTVNQFSQDERMQLESLPLHLHLDNLLIVHASYRSDYDTIKIETSAEELEEMFTGSDETFIIRGHNHLSFSVSFNNRHIESLGSTGLPLDSSPQADYAILEKYGPTWHVKRQAIEYDRETTIQRFTDTGYLEEGGPIAKLFLQELLSSRIQLIPFLNNYKQWSQNETLTMTQAVDAFIASQS